MRLRRLVGFTSSMGLLISVLYSRPISTITLKCSVDERGPWDRQTAKRTDRRIAALHNVSYRRAGLIKHKMRTVS